MCCWLFYPDSDFGHDNFDINVYASWKGSWPPGTFKENGLSSAHYQYLSVVFAAFLEPF